MKLIIYSALECEIDITFFPKDKDNYWDDEPFRRKINLCRGAYALCLCMNREIYTDFGLDVGNLFCFELGSRRPDVFAVLIWDNNVEDALSLRLLAAAQVSVDGYTDEHLRYVLRDKFNLILPEDIRNECTVSRIQRILLGINPGVNLPEICMNLNRATIRGHTSGLNRHDLPSGELSPAMNEP